MLATPREVYGAEKMFFSDSVPLLRALTTTGFCLRDLALGDIAFSTGCTSAVSGGWISPNI